MSKQILLWLDDSRNPFEDDWLNFSPIGKDVIVEWVKSYNEFIDWITLNGLPDAICFDHDLGDYQAFRNGYPEYFEGQSWPTHELTGYDCAKWLVDYCEINNKSIPLYAIQSANPVGKENIKCYLEGYKKIKAEENLLKWYHIGFKDELNGTSSVIGDQHLLKAYQLGATHAILGDDNRNFDYLSNAEILKEIQQMINRIS